VKVKTLIDILLKLEEDTEVEFYHYGNNKELQDLSISSEHLLKNLGYSNINDVCIFRIISG